MTLHSSSKLALAFCRWLLVELAGAKFGQQTCFLNRAFEAAHGYFERLIFFHANARHEKSPILRIIKMNNLRTAEYKPLGFVL